MVPLSSDSAPTEEDVRLRILAPFLVSVGVSPNRLKAERSFRIHLGHHAYDKHGYASTTASGRLDLLISNEDDEPLFIVESKRPSQNLTQADVDQGISYARLLPRIAPFVLVTNGRESRLYDSITRCEMNGSQFIARWPERGAFASGDDIELRAEALEHFIAYSSENLQAFSQVQVSARMRGLLDSTGVATGRFLPDAYVTRAAVRAVLADFLASEKSVFVLDGPSGAGKTNELCAIARALLVEHFVLFFRAAEGWGSFADRLADEFNWRFSDQIRLPQVFGRLRRLAVRCGRPIVIIVDGVDEYNEPTAAQQLNDVAERVAEFGGLLRLMVSMKTSEWPHFARNRRVPSALQQAVFRRSQDDRAHATDSTTSVTISRFEPAELEEAVERYRSVFRFRGRLSHELGRLLTDPFLLRVVADVYANQELPPNTGQAALLAEYLGRRLETLATESRKLEARRVLMAVAKKMVDVNDEPVEERPEYAQGLDGAVECGILTADHDELGRRQVAFTFERVRDFVIAYEAFRLDRQQDAGFTEIARELVRTPIGRAALKLYLDNLPQSSTHHQAFGPIIELGARRMIRTVNSIRAQLAASVQSRLSFGAPAGPVALLFSVDPYELWTFGAVNRETAPDEVVQEIGLWDRGRRGGREVPLKLHHQSAWAMLADPETFGGKLVFDRLQELIAGGGLDESGSSVLAIEKAFAIVGQKRQELRMRHSRSSNYSVARAGLDLDHIDVEAILRAVHARYAEREADYRSYRETLDRSARNQAIEDARKRALDGERFLRPRAQPLDPLCCLEDALDVLRGLSLSEVKHYLPAPSSNDDMQRQSLHWAYTEDGIKSLLNAVVEAVATEWWPFFQRNFGALAPQITRGYEAPRISAIRFGRAGPAVFGDDGSVWYGCAEERRSGGPEITVGESIPENFPGSRDHWALQCDTSFDSFIGAKGRVPIGWNTGSSGYLTPVRELLYERLRAIWESIGPESLLPPVA
jgi:Type I restriction enzyme R protein N terminus (HSDR_N)